MIAIVGGGITGLAAAYELSTRNVPFVLLEASDRFGGLIRTDQIDDLTIESGADSMLAQKPAAIELCEALGLGPRLISTTPPRTAFVHARDRLYPIPSPSVFGIPTTPEGIDAYELLSPAARARLKANFTLPPRAVQGDESVGDFFRRQFGDETVATIAEPLLGGIHAGDVERLSIAAVAPRLVEAEASDGSVLRAFSRRTAEASADGAFRSLRGGMGELVKTLIDALPAGSLWPSTPVTGVAPGDPGWNVTSSSSTFTADAVILALPAHRAAAALIESPAIAALCARVPYVSTASVALAWPRAQVPHPLNGTGFVVARQQSALRITACSWVSSKWAGRAPDEVALLRVFLGGATAPEILERTDDELIRIAVDDVSAVLGIATPPAFARLHRWAAAGAQHNVGHRALMRQIEAHLAHAPGLFVAGSGFNAIGVPDCIADGRRVAALARFVR
jgi:oxygen-dependent protoporphyrinogen oxidase